MARAEASKGADTSLLLNAHVRGMHCSLNYFVDLSDNSMKEISQRRSPKGSMCSNIFGAKMPLTTSGGEFIELHKCLGRLGGSIFRSLWWETDAPIDSAT